MAIPFYALGIDSSLLDELVRLPGGCDYHPQPIHSLDAIPAPLHEAPLSLFLIDLDRMGWGPLSEIQAMTSQSGRAAVLAVVQADTLAQHRAVKFFKVQEFLIQPVHPVQLEMALERCRNLHQLRQVNSRLRRAADRYRLELAEQIYCRPADLLPPESAADSSSVRKAIDQSGGKNGGNPSCMAKRIWTA
jgi:DNA-binding NtrC family response regulator